MNELFLLAKVVSQTSSGTSLIFPGESAPSAKKYKKISGSYLYPNDTVLCVRVSGTILILGRVNYE